MYGEEQPFVEENSPFLPDSNFWMSGGNPFPQFSFPPPSLPLPTPLPKRVEFDSEDDDENDSTDENYKEPPPKKRDERGQFIRRGGTTRKKAAARRRGPSEEEKQQTKRKRDEDRLIIDELRDFLEAGAKSKLQAEKQAAEMKLQANQTDYIVYLTNTLAAQHVMIATLNQELYQMGKKQLMVHDEPMTGIDWHHGGDSLVIEPVESPSTSTHSVMTPPPLPLPPPPPPLVDKPDKSISARDSLMLELGLLPSPANARQEPPTRRKQAVVEQLVEPPIKKYLRKEKARDLMLEIDIAPPPTIVEVPPTPPPPRQKRQRTMPKTLTTLEECLTKQNAEGFHNVQVTPPPLVIPPAVEVTPPRVRLLLKPPVKIKTEPVEDWTASMVVFEEQEEEEGCTGGKDESLYTWRIVEEKNPRSMDIYGFTAPQLMVMQTRVLILEAEAVKTGRKSAYGEGQIFLIFLYHFTHYTSLKVMREKFHMGTSTLQHTVARMLSTITKGFFSWSWHEEEAVVTHYVHACYFLTVNGPTDSKTAADLWDRVRKKHGFHIHCVHDLTTRKVVAYYLSSSPDADPQWLAQYEPLLDDDDDIALNYEKRMHGKFAISTSRYRGVLKEFHSYVGCLLALTNLDLGYGNPILDPQSVIIDL